MGLLDGLMGGLTGGQAGAGGGIADFIQRFDRGAPYDGIGDKEALDHYGAVAGKLSPQEYRESAEQAFARLSPDERRQFADFLRSRAQQHGQPFPDANGDGVDDRLQDPRGLAEATARLHERGPGVLRGMLQGSAAGGGGAGGLLANPMAKVALAGIAAMAMRRMTGGRGPF